MIPSVSICSANKDLFCGPAICPREILMLVFFCLPSKDLINVSFVCRGFKDISQSISKEWLYKLCNATAIVLGNDMRNKDDPDLLDYRYEGISHFTHLFFKKQEVLWYVNQYWENKKTAERSDYYVFYLGNPLTLEIQQAPCDKCFFQITKISDNWLIGLEEENYLLNIFKYSLCESSSISNYSFERNKEYSYSRESTITSEGLLAIGEQLSDSILVTICDCIGETIISSKEIATLQKKDSLRCIKLLPYHNENCFALIYNRYNSCFLSIFSCKDHKELSYMELHNNFRDSMDTNMIIEREKMAISSSSFVQVVDLNKMEVLFSKEGSFQALHRNKLIIINYSIGIEIYPLSSAEPSNPITIFLDNLELFESKSCAISNDLIAVINGQDIKLFNLNSGEHVTTFSTATIDHPGIPHSIYFEMKGIDSYLCVILEDTRVIYYSPKDFQKSHDLVINISNIHN